MFELAAVFALFSLLHGAATVLLWRRGIAERVLRELRSSETRVAAQVRELTQELASELALAREARREVKALMRDVTDELERVEKKRQRADNARARAGQLAQRNGEGSEADPESITRALDAQWLK